MGLSQWRRKPGFSASIIAKRNPNVQQSRMFMLSVKPFPRLWLAVNSEARELAGKSRMKPNCPRGQCSRPQTLFLTRVWRMNAHLYLT